MGWERLTNGDPLRATEQAGLDLLLTPEQRIQYRQDLSLRTMAIVVRSRSSQWSRVRLNVAPIAAAPIAAAAGAATPGSYVEGSIPFRQARGPKVEIRSTAQALE
jgi:hypothetical protein